MQRFRPHQRDVSKWRAADGVRGPLSMPRTFELSSGKLVKQVIEQRSQPPEPPQIAVVAHERIAARWWLAEVERDETGSGVPERARKNGNARSVPAQLRLDLAVVAAECNSRIWQHPPEPNCVRHLGK